VTDSRNRPDDRPNSGSLPLVDQLQALEGEEAPADQDAVLDPDEIESEPGVTDTEIYLGELEAGVPGDRLGTAGDVASIEGLADRDFRSGETDDPYVAAEEGLTWVPPVDPPVVPSDDPQGVEIAAGTGVSALADPYDDDHRQGDLSDELDLTSQIREALRADAATSSFADQLEIVTRNSTAIVRGPVDSLDDGDSIAEVVGRVKGIDEVVDQTTVEGL
jgi:hypothetical protein